ncbi:MAG: hypothetical protein LLF96_04840 [Eubacteriales bacterium]|nr:hypothetical protein [Eubacteriales bacterium]
MEGIIFLVVIYFLFQFIVKRAKEINSKAGPANTNVHPPVRVQTARVPQNKNLNTMSNLSNPAQKQTVMMPVTPREPYQPIQPTVLVNDSLYQYSGSLGGASSEGSSLLQGTRSTEGNASTEGSISSQGGEVFVDTVLHGGQFAYAQGQNEEPAIVLPEEWNRDALIQGVVMKEILDRPGKRGVRNG